MLRNVISTMVIAASLATPTLAQTSPAYYEGRGTSSVLLAGEPVRMRLAEEITTKGEMLWEGRRFRLEVVEPVMIGGRALIPQGSVGTGEIVYVRNKGMWGKRGRLGVRLVSVNVGDRTIRLSGVRGKSGTPGTLAVAGALITYPVLGFFITGTSARLPMGTMITGYTDEDIPLINGTFAKDASHYRPVPRRVPAVMGVDD